jgi:hypothetical protein
MYSGKIAVPSGGGGIVMYFPVLQDYYIFSFDFHIFLKLHDTFEGNVNHCY